MERLILDANILLRFLRKDHRTQYPKAEALMHQAETGAIRLVLLDAVVAETVFVLESVYRIDRVRIAQSLRPFLFHSGVQCRDRDVLADAFQRYTELKVDFMDALLAAEARHLDCAVVSFDRDFRKMKDIDWVNPANSG